MTDNIPNCPHCGSPPNLYHRLDGTPQDVHCITCGTRCRVEKWMNYGDTEARRWARKMKAERDEANRIFCNCDARTQAPWPKKYLHCAFCNRPIEGTIVTIGRHE